MRKGKKNFQGGKYALKKKAIIVKLDLFWTANVNQFRIFVYLFHVCIIFQDQFSIG